MKVTIKKEKENHVLLEVEVPKEIVRKKYDEVYEKISNEAKIPGFRPGKAPRHVLEQHHGGLAKEEVIKSLVSETYQESVKKENIEVIDSPEISEVKLDADVLLYKAQVEVRPQIKIKQYKGLKIKKNPIKVEPKEVEEYIAGLKKTRAEGIENEVLAKSLGYATAEELVDCLSKQLFLKKENEERARLEKDLIEQVVKGSSFQTPKILVDRRIQELEHQARHQMVQYGLPEDRIQKRVEEFKPKFKTEAEEQVKVFLVLEEIAKLEKIKVDDHMLNHVVEFLFACAQWS